MHRIAMKKDQPYRLYVDGAAKGNPGDAGVGVVLLDGNGHAVLKVSRYIGRATNNQAEYRGLILGLEESLRVGVKDIVVFTDSELMERQISGRYRVKDAMLKHYHGLVRRLLRSFRSYRIASVPRVENMEADRLASQAARNGQNKEEESEFRIQNSE